MNKQLAFVMASTLAIAVNSAASADLIYDNGDPDEFNGYGNVFNKDLGLDRRVADDFVLTGGPGWIVDNVEMNIVWATLGVEGTATEFLVQFFADDAGGGPGTLISEQVSIDHTSTATGNLIYRRAEFIFSVNIAPVPLAADTNYWVSIQPNANDNVFQLTSHNPSVLQDEAYVFYPDFGQTEWTAGSVQFGMTADMSFRLIGEAVGEPCPWDLDDDGSVGVSDLLELLEFWGDPYGLADLLDLLAAWGPCR